MCLQTGHLHTLNADVPTIIFMLSNITLYWKAGSGTVPLHLRVTTGTTSASATQLNTSISALEGKTVEKNLQSFCQSNRKSHLQIAAPELKGAMCKPHGTEFVEGGCVSSNYGPTNDAPFLTDYFTFSFLSNKDRKVKTEVFLFYLAKITVSKLCCHWSAPMRLEPGGTSELHIHKARKIKSSYDAVW